MNKKLAAVLGVGAVLAVLASTAFAAVQVVFKAELKPAKAGKSAALDVQLASSEPGQPQPPIMNRIVIKFNKGGKYNYPEVPTLQAREPAGEGPERVPKRVEDRHGHWRRSGAAGRRGPGERQTDALQRLEGRRQGRGVRLRVPGPRSYVRDRLQDLAEGAGQLRLHAGLLDPADQDAAERARRIGHHRKDQDGEEDVKKGKKKYPLIVAPKKCTGTWKSEAQFFFATGATVTTKYSGKCSK